MTETPTPLHPGRLDRRTPPLGGFNLAFLGIELRRLLRNRRTVVLTLVAPVVLSILFTSTRRVQVGGTAQEASVIIGIAVYGAMLAATAGGAMVSVERALGWSRQLRLTPLRPAAYISIKLITAMTLGLASVVIVLGVAAARGVQMPLGTWLLSGALAWIGGLVFAACGLFLGYLLPSENAMQIIGPVLAVFALFGGLFVPINKLPATLQDVAPFMPPYGVAAIARFPLLGGDFDWVWLLSAVAWAAAFAAGAMLLFQRDTRRT